MSRERLTSTFHSRTSSGTVGPFFAGVRDVVQRSVIDGEDPMHRPLIDDYRTRHGLLEGEGPSDAEIKYRLIPDDAASILRQAPTIFNQLPYTHPDYVRVFRLLPDTTSVWSMLTSRAAREQFIAFLVHSDDTNCRPYSTGGGSGSGEDCSRFVANLNTFSNACMGFATQMFARYSSTYAPDAAERSRLSGTARIETAVGGSVLPAKYRLPILLAMIPGHAFNAFQVDTNAEDINSYVFLEPQNDVLFRAGDATFRQYSNEGLIEIERLNAFGERGDYQTQVLHNFVTSGSGAITHEILTPPQRINLHRLFQALHIGADADAWRYSIAIPGITFETYFHQQTSTIPNADMVLAARFVVGRQFRRTLGGVLETLTLDNYITLTQRPDLRALIPATP